MAPPLTSTPKLGDGILIVQLREGKDEWAVGSWQPVGWGDS